jgi:hypothetical protein
VPWDMLGPYLKHWICKLIIWMCENDFAAFRDNLTKVSVSCFSYYLNSSVRLFYSMLLSAGQSAHSSMISKY